MEENSQNLNTAPTPVVSTFEPEKKKFLNKKWLVLGLIIVALVLISAGTAYFFLNSNKQVACTQEAKLCPDGSSVGRTGPNCEFTKCPTPTPDPTADWQAYTRSKLGFSIKYPVLIGEVDENWQYEEFENSVGFGPPSSKSGGYLWSVYVYSGKTIEQLIKEVGNQFNDRRESRSNIIVDGKPGTFSTVTTNQASGWISKIVYIEQDEKIYTIENGAIEIPEFENFYNSFKFTDQTPTPTCRPRPACLDATPRCLIPETSDMCPPTTTPSQ